MALVLTQLLALLVPGVVRLLQLLLLLLLMLLHHPYLEDWGQAL